MLIDLGSTFTKVTAVDVERKVWLGSAHAHTTAQTDVNEGLARALQALETRMGAVNAVERYACSSAAGGLRMIVSGLVPDLTAKAARLASLGAGAKVIQTYAYELTDEDATEIAHLSPDIFVLTGGTDGGNRAVIAHNARVLAAIPADFPILLAGNRSAAVECETILSGRDVQRVPNVMPRLGVLDAEPLQAAIRTLFLRRIVAAKGLSNVAESIAGALIPTPAAVLRAVELLASSWGELIAVDIGGATTDVYSIASGLPTNDGTVIKGLPEPRSKRTVEADIGMRYGARSVCELAGVETLAEMANVSAEAVETWIESVSQHPDALPQTPEQTAIDHAIACAAIEIAVTRHAGTIEEVYTPAGRSYVQTGKDLTRVQRLVLTGGAIVHDQAIARIAAHAMFDPRQPHILKPKRARIAADKRYLLAAMGLLCERHPEAALAIMNEELVEYGIAE